LAPDYSTRRARWRGSLTSNWIGEHWLNSLNTFEAPAYAVVDASLGYRFEHFTVAILASNLGNRRDAVQLSELGEEQFYQLPARRGCDVDLALQIAARAVRKKGLGRRVWSQHASSIRLSNVIIDRRTGRGVETWTGNGGCW
jgi:outer membrane receptor protein involved in Fe transport